MELILLGHIIGDFYVQTDKLAEKKKNSIKYMLIHCLIYTIVVGIGFYELSREIVKTLIILGLIFLSHLIIDLIKRKCNKKVVKYEYIIFLIDQVIHIMILLLIVYIAKLQINNNLMLDALNMKTCVVVASAVLVCWKPASIFVSLVFKIIPETIEQVGQTMKANKKAETEGIKIGSWIGILEREIIFILGLMGQFGAIGFVLTAKSLARFKQLESKSFAEKYLVGTLLSAFIAIVCIVICKFYIQGI
ncbi:MAG: DUF3307 domain-containing protein [Lachnospiraceae bacterium]|nr:DUF3307 domain-containing protein [Lachnospiraceae bacterium]